MHMSPDEIVFCQYNGLKLSATIVYTWGLMALMSVSSLLVTRKLTSEDRRSRWQNLLEIIVIAIRDQIREVGISKAEKYLGFIGTLFLFVAFANACTIFPFYEPPTSSLSTTIALALSIFFAVPIYGILEKGFFNYLKSYLEPTFLMLPFNIIGELTRTVALAVRLFGNMMSGVMIVAILLSIAPLFIPLIMIALGLLTGMVQAYIFSILATVFIAAAVQTDETRNERIKMTDNKPEKGVDNG